MTWLGEALADQSGATRAERRTKDVIEEKLFARRSGLFNDLSVVLFDTTEPRTLRSFMSRTSATLKRHLDGIPHRQGEHYEQYRLGEVLAEFHRR